MLKGLHPYKNKTYIIDKNLNIHITTTSIQSKYITHDSLESNKYYMRCLIKMSKLESSNRSKLEAESNETTKHFK